MATTSNDGGEKEGWQLAKDGIDLFINNKISEANDLFRKYPDNVQVCAGYSFVIFMDALMTFEDDKLALALATLKEVEQKINSQDQSWGKLFRTKLLGVQMPALTTHLEEQIILADTNICYAILTFLQQDFSGYLKCGWILRKSWKIYQRVYNEILMLHEKVIGKFVLPGCDVNNTINPSAKKIVNSSTITEIYLQANSEDADLEVARPDGLTIVPSTSTSTSNPSPVNSSNGYTTSSKSKLSQSKSSYSISNNKNSPRYPSIKKSGSVNSSLSGHTSDFRRAISPIFSPFSNQLSYFTNAFYGSSSHSNDNLKASEIDVDTVTRLMSAICFGYGLFQLGASLLPLPLLKITSFFGFGSNREAGIANLMYARLGKDMRAPLATLSLLWYHTIVRPYYAVDGSNIQAGVNSAKQLIAESEECYGQSALFLFFKGRIHRLNSDIPSALTAFEASVTHTQQREIKILSLHEVGWCNLLQLNFSQAQYTFNTLKHMSRFSRTFYAYLSTICAGSCDKLTDFDQIQELKSAHESYLQKGSQLEVYLQRRLNIFPAEYDTFKSTDMNYWRLFVYELLYLWNSFPSCSYQCREKIVLDCDNDGEEPMKGMSNLLKGSCYALDKNYNLAIESYRSCLARREGIPNAEFDSYIPAFAECELAMLLIKAEETRPEGKTLLLHAQSYYKGYDFENRLILRIQAALASLE